MVGRTPGRSDASRLAASAADERHYAHRADEIMTWLDAHPSVLEYVIIDDRASASNPSLAERFVQTDASVGLSEDDARRCRMLLLGKAREPA